MAWPPSGNEEKRVQVLSFAIAPSIDKTLSPAVPGPLIGPAVPILRDGDDGSTVRDGAEGNLGHRLTVSTGYHHAALATGYPGGLLISGNAAGFDRCPVTHMTPARPTQVRKSDPVAGSVTGNALSKDRDLRRAVRVGNCAPGFFRI